MCAAVPPLRWPDPSHVPLPHLPRRFPPSRRLSPPCHATRCPPESLLPPVQRTSPSLLHRPPPCSPAPLPSPTYNSLPRRRPTSLVLSCPVHVALLLPELRRGCHVRRRRQLLLAPITSSSGPRAPSLAPLEHVLAFAHFPSIQFPLTRSPLLTGPPPPSLLTVGSSPHYFPSSI
jgi:hypothetical protein